jgi:uncharacterized protein (TIGR01244 family)
MTSPQPDLTGIYNYLPLEVNILTSGQPSREQFEAVAAEGVQTVINLALPTSSNALPDEESIVKSLGMDYVHIPVIWERPTRANLDAFFSVLESQAGKKVLVHCAANMRVSAFVALYRIKQLGWEKEKALKDTHRIWDPYSEPVWGQFFEDALKK